MDTHKNKVLNYLTDWASELKRRNNGRRKSSCAIRTINARVNRLKEIGCTDLAIECLLSFRDQIIRNGRASYNKMSLRKIVMQAREIYKITIEHPNKNKSMSHQPHVRKPDIEEYSRIIDDVCKEQKFCVEHVKQCANELSEINKQIEDLKSQIEELENNLSTLKTERDFKDYSMRDFAAKYKINLEEINS